MHELPTVNVVAAADEDFCQRRKSSCDLKQQSPSRRVGQSDDDDSCAGHSGVFEDFDLSGISQLSLHAVSLGDLNVG